MPFKDEDLREFARLCQLGDDFQSALNYLRSRGYSKGVSILAFRMAGITNCPNAKLTVHRSRAWADVRAAHEKFHEALDAALESLNLLGEDSAAEDFTQNPPG